jgi:aspartate/methionine/tyrosine aminotransferase
MTALLEPFHAITISAIAQRLMAEGRSVIRMEYGQPSTGAPAAALARARAVLDEEDKGYWESTELLARLAGYVEETTGVAVSPDQIVLTCGASPALVIALSLRFAPGARVAIARHDCVPNAVTGAPTVMRLSVTCAENSAGRSLEIALDVVDVVDAP